LFKVVAPKPPGDNTRSDQRHFEMVVDASATPRNIPNIRNISVTYIAGSGCNNQRAMI